MRSALSYVPRRFFRTTNRSSYPTLLCGIVPKQTQNGSVDPRFSFTQTHNGTHKHNTDNGSGESIDAASGSWRRCETQEGSLRRSAGRPAMTWLYFSDKTQSICSAHDRILPPERRTNMKKVQSRELDRKKFFSDPVLVCTVAFLMIAMLLFVLYPLIFWSTASRMNRPAPLPRPALNGC